MDAGHGEELSVNGSSAAENENSPVPVKVESPESDISAVIFSRGL